MVGSLKVTLVGSENAARDGIENYPDLVSTFHARGGGQGRMGDPQALQMRERGPVMIAATTGGRTPVRHGLGGGRDREEATREKRKNG